MATPTQGLQRGDWTDPAVEEVVPGVHRIPLPLPDDGLRAVNVYALADDGGLVLVDAGWAITAGRQRLERALATLDHDLGDVRRFLVTHLHRDHYELALEVRALFGSRIALGVGERPSMAALLDRGREPVLVARLRSGGAGDLVDRVVAAGGLHRDEVGWAPPDDWLDDGHVATVGGRRLEVLATPGHTRGHVVFVDRDDGLLFAGDHVLPHITPSIGFEEAPPRSALADFLISLGTVRTLPDLRLLPAHGAVHPTTHDRVDELLAHHEVRLDQSWDALDGDGATARDVAEQLPWTRRATPFAELDPLNRMLAVNETIAHLDVLVRRDRAAVTTTDDDLRHYRA